ncbi:hypothetical protein GOB83_12275 [Acetobacter fabarum]|uniref:Uncharacterized protein n=1 Tax=Acetobacter fabarum TaxID=483199 RepID=A0A269XXB4_9PROT|nr:MULTISPECIES: hypothetical protein [Acetobacter]MCH4025263.1 hypothetical protein [Acetobacter fabarum]MCH4055089.1 hypothetical protein [Acetobacter fabarum]MCH4128771.1 hypothetical protein [Acetobacter fabarum]MCH4141988.1 hypothetical protein [Acetobacter fabarum]MCI1244263.1 hypothetical protein [Acetobacter fabarum]
MLRKPGTTPGITTPAALKTLRQHGPETLSDLQFLENWTTRPCYTAASVLRAGQIRRTNPALMNDITAGMRQHGK